ncbi:TetR/AcrR family transcriptional regulator [Hazenella sp. IB182357]|uniref:TetR/AcrR family transcriptional regulator n=1 Tax=Polycladospora coralii TaxID=2771432 RepID=A0A926RWZ6_9BACL|nr:TetR/AcrR family transcriptional regulator [Polycladospora coralii]MBD1372031.1 TetR/AcrR family transcriptional regulator [Polycladospora coralii]
MRHEKVDLIFQAAVQIFSDRGFDQAKMDEIAQAAGVAKGTIYYHFDSKEDLFVGLMNEGLSQLTQYVERNLEGAFTASDQLYAIIEAHVQFFVENGKLAKLLLNEAFDTQERQLQFRAKVRNYISVIDQVIQTGVRNGEFEVKHSQELAVALFGAASVMVLHKIYAHDIDKQEELQAQTPAILSTLEMIMKNVIKMK